MQWSHHTRIKLRLLRQYLWVCAKVHKDEPEKFTYFETHAGDGLAEFDDGKTEDGSALLAANIAVNDNIPFKIVLMERENCEKLKERLEEFSSADVICGDCNREINKLLEKVPKYYHSLGFLDPFGPNDLKWTTVYAIIHHAHTYRRGNVRRPELLINFPLKRIKENAGNLYRADSCSRPRILCKQNDDFFGNDKWRDIWSNYRNDSEKSREMFKLLYKQNFENYYKYYYEVLVSEINTNAPLYYLMFFSNDELADKIFRDLRKNIEKWKKEDWIRLYLKVQPLDIWWNSEKKETSKPRQASLSNF